MEMFGNSLTPKEIVDELDKYIVGQANAKRAVAIALRNRFRRMQVKDELRVEITPKNILMIGPTGVGKTEIARRLAKLAQAPFIKVEATKFTEVGYVGRDVESIIRDLMETSYKITKEEAVTKVKERAAELAVDRILDVILPVASTINVDTSELADASHIEDEKTSTATKNMFRKKIINGALDDKEIEIEVSQSPVGIEIMAPPGMEEMTSQLQGIFQNMSNNKKRVKKMTVKAAYKLIQEEEAMKLVNDEDIKADAVRRTEQTGIVFLDEIDKVTQRSERQGGDVSREGVQRDLLPLIEGSSVTTKYGIVKTDHILFIASGAFHLAKPSDLIPELQGRLPIRVELEALTVDDFTRILTEPDASLTEQHKELLATENVHIEFTKTGIKEIATLAFNINERTLNIGARRLHTMLEKLLEEISFSADEHVGDKIVIDKKYVNKQLAEICEDDDLSKFIL